MTLASANPVCHLLTREWTDASRRNPPSANLRSDMEVKSEYDWAPLLDRVRAGEEQAGRELVEALWPRVAGRIAGLCPRRDEIEDLAQEVFLKVFTRLGQYRGGSFPAWIDVLTRRVCYDSLRKQKVRPEWRFSDLPNFEVGEIVDRGSAPTGDDARAILAFLFQKLPSHEAWLLKRVELEECSIGVVSREMGWTEVAGRLRLLRARRKLKAVYDRWNGEMK